MAFFSSAKEDSDETSDYNASLKEATECDLTDVLNSGCVTRGIDESGLPIIVFIPRIGLGNGERTEELLRKMFLLFIKTADAVISAPYSIMYSHISVRWGHLGQQPVIYEYYKMLPRSYKKNIQKIYVLHPQMGMKVFFEFTRVFLSHKFYSKLQFVDSIADFQQIISPTTLVLPHAFLSCEDEDKKLKPSEHLPPLSLDFNPKIGATTMMVRCANYLRLNGGLVQKGIFRIPGNENILNLVKVRMKPSPSCSRQEMVAFLKCVVVGLDSHKYLTSAGGGAQQRTSVLRARSFDSAASIDSMKATPLEETPLSTVVISDIDTVAQVLKMSLRDLPEPLFTFMAFDDIMKLTASMEAREISRSQWNTLVTEELKKMPVEHSSTLAYLLDFLREVGAHSEENNMDLANLALVFAPSVMRPRVQDNSNPAQVFNEVRRSQTIMHFLLTLEESDRMVGVTTLLGSGLSSSVTSALKAPGGGREISSPLFDEEVGAEGTGDAQSHGRVSFASGENAIAAKMGNRMVRRVSTLNPQTLPSYDRSKRVMTNPMDFSPQGTSPRPKSVGASAGLDLRTLSLEDEEEEDQRNGGSSGQDAEAEYISQRSTVRTSSEAQKVKGEVEDVRSTVWRDT